MLLLAIVLAASRDDTFMKTFLETEYPGEKNEVLSTLSKKLADSINKSEKTFPAVTVTEKGSDIVPQPNKAKKRTKFSSGPPQPQKKKKTKTSPSKENETPGGKKSKTSAVSDLSQLNTKVGKLEQDVAKLEQVVTTLNTELASLKAKVSGLEKGGNIAQTEKE